MPPLPKRIKLRQNGLMVGQIFLHFGMLVEKLVKWGFICAEEVFSFLHYFVSISCLILGSGAQKPMDLTVLQGITKGLGRGCSL